MASVEDKINSKYNNNTPNVISHSNITTNRIVDNAIKIKNIRDKLRTNKRKAEERERIRLERERRAKEEQKRREKEE